ncbi:tat pathway signal sequence [Cordyceps javanica]|uniref:Tat pathway signal sequence n=1 Tax=Cordyceps javanica TaxID=43265 RepID=A0A545UNJ6_9HYPO|nr:tat pathway signal sequence [Cordyceps javanica]TQW02787.1 tat pathway signal sequence [Cordyceps javanica]
MSSFKQNVKDWCYRFFDHQPAQRATMYMPSGNSSSRDSLDASSDDVGEGLIEKQGHSRLPRLVYREPWWKRTSVLVIGHMVLFTVYAAVLFAVLKSKKSSARMEGMPISPAIPAIKWEEHKFSLEDKIQEKGSFSGKPNADLDKAWHDLLNYENIIIEPEIMAHYDRLDVGVAVPEGGGYLGTLNVYHELHCLKRLHQYMYPDYYFGDLTAEQHEMNRLHNEHCIDFLRQSSMCHGDIGLITYEWHDNSRIPVANATMHQCVNWQQLDDWTRARSVDMMKPGWLVHPIFGLAYPDGEGDKIGAVDPHGHLVGQNHGHGK